MLVFVYFSLQAKLLLQNQTSDFEVNSDFDSGSGFHLKLDNSESDNSSAVDMCEIPSKWTLNSEDHLGSTLSDRLVVSVPCPLIDDDEFQSLSYKSISSADYSVDPALQLREAEKIKQADQQVIYLDDALKASICSVQGETFDEDYYLIDTESVSLTTTANGNASFPVGLVDPITGPGALDVGALASRLSMLESSTLAVEDRGRVDDGGDGQDQPSLSRQTSEGCGEMTEVELGGGEVHEVRMVVERCGTGVVWEFSTEPKGIAFGISYREKMDTTQEDEVRVQQITLLNIIYTYTHTHNLSSLFIY